MFGVFAFAAVLAACSQDQVTDSVGAGAKNWCKQASNCTVYDEGAGK